MSYTKRLIILLISFFSTLLFLSAMSLIIRPLINDLDYNTTSFIIYPIYSTIAFLFFVLFHATLRIIFYKKILDNNAVLLCIKSDKITLTERLWFYIFIVLIYFLPITRSISAGLIALVPIALFLDTILLIEVILRSSIKTVKINFLRSGIVVSGFDIRLNIPMEGLGTSIRNDYGYYSYYDIENYLIFPDRVELYLIMERGKLVLKADTETLRQLKGIIAQQKLEIRKY